MVGEEPASEFDIGDWVIMPSRPKNGKGQVKAMDFSSGVWMYTVFFPDWYGGQEYIGPGEVFEKV